MPDQPTSVKFAAITHRGRARESNQDAVVLGDTWFQGDTRKPFALCQPLAAAWMLAVADGMGGANAGEVASQQVVAGLAEAKDFTPNGLAELLRQLNRDLYRLGQERHGCFGLGATVAGLACGPEGPFAFSVGDARVYQQQDRSLTQLTKDDSIAQLLVDLGQADANAMREPYQHTVTQSLGGRHSFAEIAPHIYPVRLRARSRFLLCTDGLTDMVPLEELKTVLTAPHDLPEAVLHLFDAAWRAGGRDNITIILAEVHTA